MVSYRHNPGGLCPGAPLRGPEEAYCHAIYCVRGPVGPELEDLIGRAGWWSVLYAYRCLGGRFEGGEAAIRSSPYCSWLYRQLVGIGTDTGTDFGIRGIQKLEQLRRLSRHGY